MQHESSEKLQKELPRIKKFVESSREVDKDNVRRFHASKKFVFKTSLSEEDKSVLASLNKPQIEFNVQEAYVSRLRGEFSKQEPTITVSAQDPNKIDMKEIQSIEGHVRHIMFESNKNGCEYNVYSDTLGGGFSVIKVWTDYRNPYAFEQDIYFNRVFDPTLCGFDPLARHPTKNDGRFCFELYPKSQDEMERMYPEYDWDKMKDHNNNSGFTWSYTDNNENVFLLCDFYEKKRVKTKIVMLSDGQRMTEKKYKEFMENWGESFHIEQPPQIVKQKKADLTTVVRYIFTSNVVLDCEDTDFEDLPLVFVDGNSVQLRDQENGPVNQMTRPYTYHLEGTQRLKNFAGQSLGSELQNMVQHKFIVAKESLSPQYLDAFINQQVPNIVIYNAYKDNNPDMPVPPPREVVRPPIPQEIMQTWVSCDNLAQVILGSYDASLGINDNQLSGVAVIEAATQSNAAAMPYVVGFMHALNQVGQIILNLIPKYYVTARSIPIRDSDSRRSFIRINDDEDPHSIKFSYDANDLNIKVEAGASFAIQKSKSLNQIISAAQAMPIFGQFMNEKGLGIFVRNFDIKDTDQLQTMADEYMQELAQMKQMQQQQAQQQAQQPNPAMIKLQNDQQEMQLRAHKQELDHQMNLAKFGIEQQSQENERMRIMMEAKKSQDENIRELAKHDTEKERSAVDLALGIADHHHKVSKDMLDLHHKFSQPVRTGGVAQHHKK